MQQAPYSIDFDHGITAIDVEYVRPKLDASHLILHRGRAAFVDTGTTHSVPGLLRAMADRDIQPEQVDYVFVTHVHLDHAGGAGALMQALPKAIAVVHPRGARHLAEPEKLIAGTRAVYGDEAFERMYGDIIPIPAERIHVPKDGEVLELAGRPLGIMFTEGHARHHYCLTDASAGGVFTGDSFGISYRELDGPSGPFVFPTTTPVHFDPKAAHEAVDRIMALAPRYLFLTHFSRVAATQELARAMHECLDAFVELARHNRDQPDRTRLMEQAMYACLDNRLDASGFEGTQEFRHEILDDDVRLNVQGLEFWLDHADK
ncbi:MAG: MBL fold metallo-hydrolase [Gammaproteobacteria bacterium]|jgi:glyoxylase-like metal-dependent hydrolase (beta-lactamase superfamily II)|nr:MBL fold metallo-hydrolase [Gammaproteobacteria bacterium]